MFPVKIGAAGAGARPAKWCRCACHDHTALAGEARVRLPPGPSDRPCTGVTREIPSGCRPFRRPRPKVYPVTGQRRFRVHKTVNLLEKLRKRLHAPRSWRRTRAGRPSAAPPRTRGSNGSLGATKRNIRTRSFAWPRIGSSCSRSTISRPRTGSISGRRIRSSRRSRSSACGRGRPRTALSQ